jgi:kinesin family protein 5
VTRILSILSKYPIWKSIWNGSEICSHVSRGFHLSWAPGTNLLAAQNDNLQVHEEKSKGVYVKNLSDYYVSSAREVYEIMRTGGAARVISSTSELFSQCFVHDLTYFSPKDMNAESSRSHSIFLITIQQRNTETGAQKTGNLYLVDLAGSEKVGKTGASGQTLEEAKKINKSLSALGMVINALTDSKVYI